MNRRLFAGALWFLTGWFTGSVFAFMAGLDPVLAPVVAIAAATIVVTDPRKIIWTPRATNPTAPQRAAEPA